MKYIALIVSMLTGWVISQYLLADATGAYVSVLFAYHFFLVFLVGFMDWRGGFKLPEMRAAAVHSAVLIVLLGFIAARSYIPAFSLISLLTPLLAFFEVEWIFGKQIKRHENETVPGLPYAASQDDYSEFLQYLKQPGRQFAKAGRSVKEEYGFWLADREKTLAANQALGNDAPGTTHNPHAR